MAAEQDITQAIMQAVIKVAKSGIMDRREADNLVNNAKPVCTVPRSGNPVLKQPTFDWKVADKCQELCNFEIEKSMYKENDKS